MWRSVRFRTTAAAVAAVAVALIIGSIAMIGLLRARLADDVQAGAQLRADDIAALLAGGTAPADLALEGGEEDVAQVVDRAGRVVAASANVAGRPPLRRPAPGAAIRTGVPIDDDPFLVVAAPARGTSLTVVVARSAEAVDESTAAVTQLLLAGVPLLLTLVGGVVWVLTGAALRPVDAMSREVDEINASDLHRRVAEPESRDEIARLAVTMNRMLVRLEESQRRQRQFASDASHELRSPVTTIRQHAEVAAAHPDRTTPADLAAVVLTEVSRLQHLIDDLLVLARVDEGALDLRAETIDVDDIVLAEAKRVRNTTALHVTTGAVAAGRITGDPRAVRTIVRNLVDNAARYARDRVDLGLTQDNGTVVLRVDDDGPGIETPDRDRVRERFVRLDNARSRGEGGTGLGLAIVTELAAAHGAEVTIGTSDLDGARVEVAFSCNSGAQ